ncbi:MAG: DUF2750 domain-containing protein [Alysiella sp.]|uniref:DUF2750 domain-containing protein n=1 Tax=Alysiella sp. TaxID=1872483 RepID=UPI0026DB9C5C|nr:DUF2750 domain-containing protein [Alysiella sp.]MDO4433854.1 DUF2750 domain-containing protein [Alysiella sp.]
MTYEIDPSYLQFVQHIVRNRTVYTLLDEEEYYAECPSAFYDDKLGEPFMVSCFWHSANDAQLCCTQEWADYCISEIDLEEFMFEVLLDLHEAKHLIGVAFDGELYGSEVEPINLLSDLLDEIHQQGLQDQFPNLSDLYRYCQEWQTLMDKPDIIH